MPESTTPTSQTVWNAILTVVGGAVLAAIGFLYMEVIALKEIAASTTATRFTEEEASILRSDITMTLTEVDKRLAIIENNNDWMRQWVTSGRMPAAAAPAPAPKLAPVPNPATSLLLPKIKFDDNRAKSRPASRSIQEPLYDLRQKVKK